MSNVPKLRFKEFSGEWEEKLLGDLADIKTGNKDTQDRVEDGLYPFFVRSQTIERINSYSFDGEAILTAGDGVGVGKVFHYLNKKFDYHQRVYNIHNFKENIIGKYIFFYFAERFYRRVIRLSAKNSVDSVRMEMISKMPISLPQKPEQEKIASFLTSVDTKIEQLTKKVSLLQEYKKGVMAKIFNQEIRFKADDGSEFREWEEKKFSSICVIKKGSQLNKETLNEEGDYPALNGGINLSGYTTNWNTEENTITISEGGNSCGYVNFVRTRFWSGGHNYSLQDLKESIDVQYLYQYLKLNEEAIMRLRVGSGLPNIQKGELSNFKVSVPCLEEQTKIANFLSAIDTKIELQTKELHSTKEFKKALLQQMFV